MTGRRKGTPCACSDDCGCSSSKGKCIRAINNVSPDPNGDFSVNAGTGIIISGDENGIVIANGMPDPASLIAGDNIEITAIGDDLEIALTQNPVINGDLTVNGDIIQNGAAYETHAEHIYTADDYIIMRDGAISALSAGDYSGFQVKLYDGVNDGRLVIDNSGVARVGDVGDEQPLMTRDESADLTDGDILQWDAGDQKATGISPNTFGVPNTVTSASTTGNVSLASGTSTMVIQATTPVTGTYLIAVRFEIRTNPSTTQSYNISTTVNGSDSRIIQTSGYWTDTYGRLTAIDIRSLTAGDTVELNAYQNLGSSMNANGSIHLVRLV